MPVQMIHSVYMGCRSYALLIFKWLHKKTSIAWTSVAFGALGNAERLIRGKLFETIVTTSQ